MKEVVFIMMLAFPTQAMPTHKEPMESLEACLARVAEVTKSFYELPADDDARFLAACRIEFKKSDPA